MPTNKYDPYAAIIGGPGAVLSRITGSIPRVITFAERLKLRRTLDLGGCIEVVCESRAAWEAMRDDLYAQLGIRS